MKKIVHINDVAFVGKTLVEGLRLLGHDALHVHMYDINNEINVKTGYLKRAWRAIRIQWKYSSDETVFHIHYMGNALFFLFSKARVVVHLHGTDIREPLSLKDRLLKYLILRKADYILYSTPDIGQYITPYNHKAKFLPNPISAEIFEMSMRESASSVKKIFFYAALSHIKGGDIGLTALKKIKSDFPDIEISVFGFGEYSKDASPELFNVIPRVSREEVLRILGDSDLVLGQLRVGAVGVSELEAIALGKPVITNFRYDHCYAEPMPCQKIFAADDVHEVLRSWIVEWSRHEQRDLIHQRRQWVKRYHGQEAVSNLLLSIYDNL